MGTHTTAQHALIADGVHDASDTVGETDGIEVHAPAGATTREQTERVGVAVAFGGGGAFGIAWHIAVIAALRDAGVPVDGAPAIGTSAGSWACAALRLGLSFDDFSSIGTISVPDRSPGLLAGIARELMGDCSVEDVRISAVALPRMRRRLHDASLHPIADLVAASSAVPGFFSPHPIGGVPHVDGGVRSMASVDQAPRADLLIASLPIAGPLFGPVGRVMESTSRAALARWRRTHHGVTCVLRPGRRLSQMVGLRPNALFDVDFAREIYPMAYDQVSERLQTRRHSLVAA